MRIENSFEVAAPPEAAWELLMDVPRVIPCMPGAELAETVDDDHWKAKMAVKLGPIALNFDPAIAREAADVDARRAVLSADARESKGRPPLPACRPPPSATRPPPPACTISMTTGEPGACGRT